MIGASGDETVLFSMAAVPDRTRRLRVMLCLDAGVSHGAVREALSRAIPRAPAWFVDAVIEDAMDGFLAGKHIYRFAIPSEWAEAPAT